MELLTVALTIYFKIVDNISFLEIHLFSLKKHDTYQGKRVQRGLFRTSQGYLINADTNGSANILVKFLTSNSQHLPKVVA